MSTLNSTSARRISSGVKGFDSNTPLSFSVAKQFKQNYSFAIRYVRNTDSLTSGNLTTAEAECILNAGLGLMVVQHVRGAGWSPSASLGTQDGNLCVSQCESIGILSGVSVWCDLEGVSGAQAQNVIDYCNNWESAVSGAGYRAGLYVGPNSVLSGSQFYYDLRFSNYWKSAATVPDVEYTGYQMIQSLEEEVYGIRIDSDTIQTDGAGNTPYMLTYGSTVVGIDTTTDVTKSHGGTYVFETGSPQIPTVTVGTSGVVTLTHLSRDNSNGSDLWQLSYVGSSGAAAGIYTAGPGEQPLKRFVARVA